MTTLKQGDLIKDGDGKTRKVLGVCGEVVHVSCADDHNAYLMAYTETDLKEEGYTWDTPAWEPELDKKYFSIHNNGDIYISYWGNDNLDHNRRDFLGIYQTKALAEAALLEIRRKLGK